MTFFSLVIVFACAAFALYYAFKTAKNILAASTGNEDMQRIAGAIQEGAQAYLKRQYRTIAIVGVVVAVLLLFTMSSPLWASCSAPFCPASPASSA